MTFISVIKSKAISEQTSAHASGEQLPDMRKGLILSLS
jgi:hypothetical protein